MFSFVTLKGEGVCTNIPYRSHEELKDKNRYKRRNVVYKRWI